MHLRELRELEGELKSGQRGSRFSKWIQASADKRKQAGVSDPEKIQNLSNS